MAIATAVIVAAAATAATVGAVVGAVGVGLTLVGMATKNKTLMKIGKIAGIAGGAVTLGAFAVSGAASAFAEGGMLAAESTVASSTSAAQTLGQTSIQSTAGALTEAGNPIQYAMSAGAEAGAGAATAATTAGGLASASTEGLAFAGKTFGPAMTPEQLAQQSLAAHPDAGGFDEFGLPLGGNDGSVGGTNVLNTTKSPSISAASITGAAPAALATPQTPAIGATPQAAGMMQGPASSAPAIGGAAPPQAGGAGSALDAKAAAAPDGKSFFGSLTPGEKSMLLSATVQGLGGMAGGVFGGIGQANQAKLQRWEAEERFKRGSYAPSVSFQSQVPKGMLNS